MRVAPIISILAAMAALTLCACGDKDEGDIETAPETDINALAMARLQEGEGAGRELVTTASGLHYLDIIEGEGDPPQPGQICSTHALLELLDGTRIWSSRDPGQNGEVRPFEFRLGRGGVIAGWDEGVGSMKPGGRRRLAVPPELGYGETGRDPVPPNAMLLFTIDLLEVRD